MGRRRRVEEVDERRQAPGPVSPYQTYFALGREIVDREPSHRQQQARAGRPEIARTLRQLPRLAPDDTPPAHDRRGDPEEDRAMAAGQGLQRPESECLPKVRAPATIEIGVQVGQCKWNPLHRVHVSLSHLDEAWRRERVDQATEKCAAGSEAERASQDKGACATEHARRKRGEIHRQHQVARQPDHRRGEKRRADQVFGVRKGVRKRVIDVGVEYRPRLVHQGVHVPTQRPDVQVDVGGVVQDRGSRPHRVRIRHRHREQRVDSCHSGKVASLHPSAPILGAFPAQRFSLVNNCRQRIECAPLDACP